MYSNFKERAIGNIADHRLLVWQDVCWDRCGYSINHKMTWRSEPLLVGPAKEL